MPASYGPVVWSMTTSACALNTERGRRLGHVGAVAGGQRRGELADTAGGAVDEHPLARCEPAVLEQRLPGAERRERHGRRLGVAERTRLGREQLGRDCGVVGGDPVAVERCHPVNLITNRHVVDAVPEGDHNAGQLVRGDCRKPVDGPLQLIARERRSVDAYEHLSRARLRNRDLLADELSRSAGRPQDDRPHRRRHAGAASRASSAATADAPAATSQPSGASPR
jgi:hypothetical protein